MGINLPADRLESGMGLRDYSPEVSYHVAETERDRREIYRFRYEAYRREKVIEPRPSGMFTDYYDTLPNCWTFGIRWQEELVASIRLHVISPRERKGPALDVFPDIIGPMVDAGYTVIDPTRFVTANMAMLRIPELAYITLRVPSMASLVFDAKYCLATVREEHIRFYKRALNAVQLCEPRPYPELRYRICVMRVDVPDVRDELAERYATFQTPLDHWRAAFSRPAHEPPGLIAPSLLSRPVLADA